MATYLEELAEAERLAREEQEQIAIDAGGTVLEKLRREEFKTKRRGEEPEMPESYGQFAVDQLKAAPSSGADVIEDTASALWSPWDTAEAIGNVASSFLQKGSRKYSEAISGRDQGSRGEEEIDAFMDDYGDAYGTIPRAVNTLKEDPFRAMTDFSPFGLMRRSRGATPAVDPLGIMGKPVQKILESTETPNALYRNAAGIPPSMLDKGMDIAEGGIRQDSGVGTSKAGLRHIDRVKDEIGGEINKIIFDAQSRGMSIPTQTINKYLTDYINRMRNIATLDELKGLRSMRDDFNTQFQGMDTLTPNQVQQWKTNKYETAYELAASREPSVARSTGTKGTRQHAKGAKVALEDRMPDLLELNENWSAAAQLRPFIANRIDSIAKSDPSLAKLIRSTVAHPKVQGRIAIILDRIARGDMGWVEKNLNTHEIRALIALTGRTEELMEMEGL